MLAGVCVALGIFNPTSLESLAFKPPLPIFSKTPLDPGSAIGHESGSTPHPVRSRACPSYPKYPFMLHPMEHPSVGGSHLHPPAAALPSQFSRFPSGHKRVQSVHSQK